MRRRRRRQRRSRGRRRRRRRRRVRRQRQEEKSKAGGEGERAGRWGSPHHLFWDSRSAAVGALGFVARFSAAASSRCHRLLSLRFIALSSPASSHCLRLLHRAVFACFIALSSPASSHCLRLLHRAVFACFIALSSLAVLLAGVIARLHAAYAHWFLRRRTAAHLLGHRQPVHTRRDRVASPFCVFATGFAAVLPLSSTPRSHPPALSCSPVSLVRTSARSSAPGARCRQRASSCDGHSAQRHGGARGRRRRRHGDR